MLKRITGQPASHGSDIPSAPEDVSPPSAQLLSDGTPQGSFTGARHSTNSVSDDDNKKTAKAAYQASSIAGHRETLGKVSEKTEALANNIKHDASGEFRVEDCVRVPLTELSTPEEILQNFNYTKPAEFLDGIFDHKIKRQFDQRRAIHHEKKPVDEFNAEKAWKKLGQRQSRCFCLVKRLPRYFQKFFCSKITHFRATALILQLMHLDPALCSERLHAINHERLEAHLVLFGLFDAQERKEILKYAKEIRVTRNTQDSNEFSWSSRHCSGYIKLQPLSDDSRKLVLECVHTHARIPALMRLDTDLNEYGQFWHVRDILRTLAPGEKDGEKDDHLAQHLPFFELIGCHARNQRNHKLPKRDVYKGLQAKMHQDARDKAIIFKSMMSEQENFLLRRNSTPSNPSVANKLWKVKDPEELGGLINAYGASIQRQPKADGMPQEEEMHVRYFGAIYGGNANYTLQQKEESSVKTYIQSLITEARSSGDINSDSSGDIDSDSSGDTDNDNDDNSRLLLLLDIRYLDSTFEAEEVYKPHVNVMRRLTHACNMECTYQDMHVPVRKFFTKIHSSLTDHHNDAVFDKLEGLLKGALKPGLSPAKNREFEKLIACMRTILVGQKINLTSSCLLQSLILQTNKFLRYQPIILVAGCKSAKDRTPGAMLTTEGLFALLTEILQETNEEARNKDLDNLVNIALRGGGIDFAALPWHHIKIYVQTIRRLQPALYVQNWLNTGVATNINLRKTGKDHDELGTFSPFDPHYNKVHPGS